MRAEGYFREGEKRSERHQAILELDEDELHRKYPYTKDLEFNNTKSMDQKGQNQVKANKLTPDVSVVHGSYFEDRGSFKNGDYHGYVIGDEEGHIMPKLLLKKLQTIESGKAYGNEVSIAVSDEERDKLYAIVRAAQLGGVKQFLVSEDKPEKKKAANKKRKATEAPM